MKKRLVAILTLGNLSESNAWNKLVKLTRHKHTLLSMSAFHSLIKIDPNGSMLELGHLIIDRQDWPIFSMIKLLSEESPLTSCEKLKSIAHHYSDEQLVHILQYFEQLKCFGTSNIIHRILNESHNDSLICRALAALNDPTAIHFAFEFIDHEKWYVRVQAVNAIGRLGTAKEVPYLVARLSDPEWWVRYRAARAIVKMPFVDTN
ncbi:MAG: HEAT repeat domain-containing protein, partial [Gammaproteobacteria bacterium]|nr:HEAT repeat domain-containing protein [Gammaproteobacteria bacterium]